MTNPAGLCTQDSACLVQVLAGLAQGSKHTSASQLLLQRDVPSAFSGKHQTQVWALYKCHGLSAGKRSLAVNSSTSQVNGSPPQMRHRLQEEGAARYTQVSSVPRTSLWKAGGEMFLVTAQFCS